MSHTGTASFFATHIVNAIPLELLHSRPTHVIDIVRQPRDIIISGRTYTQDSREAELFVPKGEVIDFTRAYFEFDLTLSATGGTYKRASNGIWTSVRRIEIREGDKLIQTLDNLNHLQSIIYKYVGVAENEQTLGISWGIGTQVQRNAWGTASRNYVMPIFLQSLVKKPILTSRGIHTSRLKIRIIFDAPNRWIETDGTNPGFEITNLRCVYEQITVSKNYKEKSLQFHKETGITTVFDDYSSFEQAFDTATVTLNLTPNKQSVLSLFTVFIDDASRGDTTVNDKFETHEFLAITQYHHKFQQAFFQEKPIICNKFYPLEAYQEYLKWSGKLSGQGNYQNVTKISVENYRSDDSFLLAVALESAPNDPELINNVSTHHEGDISIEIQLAAPPATRKIGLTFVQNKAIWQHGADFNSVALS